MAGHYGRMMIWYSAITSNSPRRRTDGERLPARARTHEQVLSPAGGSR